MNLTRALRGLTWTKDTIVLNEVSLEVWLTLNLFKMRLPHAEKLTRESVSCFHARRGAPSWRRRRACIACC
jgi:hypothetical protein